MTDISPARMELFCKWVISQSKQYFFSDIPMSSSSSSPSTEIHCKHALPNTVYFLSLIRRGLKKKIRLSREMFHKVILSNSSNPEITTQVLLTEQYIQSYFPVRWDVRFLERQRMWWRHKLWVGIELSTERGQPNQIFIPLLPKLRAAMNQAVKNWVRLITKGR